MLAKTAAGVLAGGVVAASAKNAPGALAATSTTTPDWLNVISYGADPTGATDSTAAINAAIAAAGQGSTPARVVYFPAGNYKITSALQTASLSLSNLALIGDGPQPTQITQVTPGASALLGSNVQFLSIVGMSFTGTTGGLSAAPGIYLETSGGGTTVCCAFTNVDVTGFQSDGISLSKPVLCSFRAVNSNVNGGNGFTFSGQGTSLTMDSCYARANAGNGYQLTSMNYCSLNGCAADSNVQGYALTGCTGVAIVGCGAEGSSSASCQNAFVLSGGTSNSLLSCYMNEIAGVGVTVEASERACTLTGCVSWHDKVTPTTFVNVAAGCVAAMLNCITDQTSGQALNLAANTTTILCDGGKELSVAGHAYMSSTNFYGPIAIPEGSDARMGTVTLNGTTAVTVATTAVTASTRIFLTTQHPSGTPGTPYVSSITAGSAFGVKSTDTADKSVVAWIMIDHT